MGRGAALAYLLTRLPLDEGNLAASGVRGIGMGFRAFIVGIPLVAITVADSRVGVAAGSSTRRVHARARGLADHILRGGGKGVKRMLSVATGSFSRSLRRLRRLETPEEEKLDPPREWTLHESIPIGLGPIDMSINKAVACLLLGTIVSLRGR